MKKYLVLLLAMLVLAGCNRSTPTATTSMSTDSETLQSSDEGQAEKIHWEKRGDVLTISGEGVLTKEHLKEAKKKWKKEIKKVVVEDGITELGKRCFATWKMTQVELPESVHTIGEFAFYYCNKMEKIHLPSGLTEIPNHLFFNCKMLKEVLIPEGVTMIGEHSFQNCINLVSVTIPKRVEELEEYLFYNCSKLEEVSIPEGVIKIGNKVFGECYSLKCISIPKGVIEIGEFALLRCTSIETLTLPEKLEKFDEETSLCGCIRLKEIVNNSAYAWKLDAEGILYGPWYCDGENVGKKIPAGKTIVMKPITYKITYDLRGGVAEEGSLPNSYQHTEGCELPRTVKREGYEFLDWYAVDFDGWGVKTSVALGNAMDMKIYAYWAKVDLVNEESETVKVKWEVDSSDNDMGMVCAIRYSENEDMSNAKICHDAQRKGEVILEGLEKGKCYYVEYAIYNLLRDEDLRDTKKYDWRSKRSIVVK